MSHVDPSSGLEEGTPAIPAGVRSVAYFVGLTVGAIALSTTGIAPIWFDPDTAGRIVQTAGVVGSVAGFVLGGLGVAYRPTRT